MFKIFLKVKVLTTKIRHYRHVFGHEAQAPLPLQVFRAQWLKRAGFERPSPIQLKAIPIGRCGVGEWIVYNACFSVGCFFVDNSFIHSAKFCHVSCGQ